MKFIRSFELQKLLKNPDFVRALPRLPDSYTLPTPVRPQPSPPLPPPPPPPAPPSPLLPISNKVFCFNLGTKILGFTLPKFLPVFAIDSGTTVSGIALIDSQGIEAYPFTAIQMRSQRFGEVGAVPVLKFLMERFECYVFVIGYPKHNNEETGNPEYSQHAEELLSTLDAEPAFDNILCTEIDETLSSQTAPVSLVMDPGPVLIDAYNRKARKDMRAACSIIKSLFLLKDNSGPFSLYNKNKYRL